MELKGPLCYVLDFDDVYNYAYQTSLKIKESGWRPDAIVGIARGGWVHGRVQCDLLGVKDLFSVKIDHWGVTATRDGRAKLTCPLNVDVHGKKVLVVDDITDTGESLTTAVEHVKSCGPADVRSATLMHIVGSKFVPNYFGVEVTWAWEIFPWNFFEDVTNLVMEIFKGEKTDRMTTAELKRHLREYNNLVLSDEQMTKIKAHMEYLGKLEKTGAGDWRVAK
ncbi:MAG: phosphoribosyltransferase [Candidatus Thorarchaeota archaeon]|nr:phosphoribosyltransferase [Candidatus Thorarchaeota archaeon]